MERLKKTNQTMLLVVGFLTAIIPAFTFTEKLYNGSNLVFYSTLISALAGVIVFLILGSKFADQNACSSPRTASAGSDFKTAGVEFFHKRIRIEYEK